MSHPTASPLDYAPAATSGKRAAAPVMPREPWDPPESTTPERAPRPIDDALGYSVDRLDRVDHMLDRLRSGVTTLTERLEPVLTDGSPATYPTMGAALDGGAAEDRRSTIARRIHALGDHADSLADSVAAQVDRLVAILDALEV